MRYNNDPLIMMVHVKKLIYTKILKSSKGPHDDTGVLLRFFVSTFFFALLVSFMLITHMLKEKWNNEQRFKPSGSKLKCHQLYKEHVSYSSKTKEKPDELKDMHTPCNR